ncbi:hypothetical protein BHM03_00060610 [Ensete ventricosum]|nr:hypothetical protein BHM03_00060610 [Ensete ventricosum]
MNSTERQLYRRILVRGSPTTGRYHRNDASSPSAAPHLPVGEVRVNEVPPLLPARENEASPSLAVSFSHEVRRRYFCFF